MNPLPADLDADWFLPTNIHINALLRSDFNAGRLWTTSLDVDSVFWAYVDFCWTDRWLCGTSLRIARRGIHGRVCD